MRSLNSLVAAIVAALLLIPATTSAQADSDYPKQPIRLISPFAPGGSSDTLARIIAPELSRRLAQQVIVENRPGAGGNIGVDAVAKARPDGYTIGLASPGPMVVNVTLMDSLPYDPLKDVVPISLIADLPIVMVAHPSVAANNVTELIALEKSKPGSLSFASAGVGTTMHLSGELLNMMTGMRLVHVAYKGAAPAMTDILGGQVQLGFVDLPAASAQGGACEDARDRKRAAYAHGAGAADDRRIRRARLRDRWMVRPHRPGRDAQGDHHAAAYRDRRRDEHAFGARADPADWH